MSINGVDKSSEEVTVSFSGETINVEATFFNSHFTKKDQFRGTIFNCKAKFVGAVFEEVADFTLAKFYGDVDFTGVEFKKGVSFRHAQFGKPYPKYFGDWEIQFADGEMGILLKRRNKNLLDNARWEDLGNYPEDPNSLNSFLKPWGMEAYTIPILESFRLYSQNPRGVSFKECCFGDCDLSGISREKIKEILKKEEDRINGLSDDFFNEKQLGEIILKEFQSRFDDSEIDILMLDGNDRSNLLGLIFRHFKKDDISGLINNIKSFKADFTFSKFYNVGNVEFCRSVFLLQDVKFHGVEFKNGENVGFSSVVFCNKGEVGFSSVIFGNTGMVNFSGTVFANEGGVCFDFSSFQNSKEVYLSGVEFKNRNSVGFRYVNFRNSGIISFCLTKFLNGDEVNFSGAVFNCTGIIYFSYMVFMNLGSLNFSLVNFGDKRILKFFECLFISQGNILYRETRFPEAGSLIFQRCHFSPSGNIDFSDATFHSAIFEGGEIDQKEPEDGQKNLLWESLDNILEYSIPELREKIKNSGFYRTKFTHVFEEGVIVFWKDLTQQSAQNLTFRMVNLGGSIFDGRTLSFIQLNAPTWADYKGRYVLCEEKQFRESGEKLSKEKLSNIEDQYTQLKNNLEQQGNYFYAGVFHYGEQEIRRERILLSGEKRLEWFATTLYRECSGYGEMPKRALIVLLLMILNLALFLVPLSPDFVASPLFGEGSHSAQKLVLMAKETLVPFFDNVVKVITPFSWRSDLDEINKALGFYFLLIMGQILVLAVQLPLFVLAVRRWFKR